MLSEKDQYFTEFEVVCQFSVPGKVSIRRVKFINYKSFPGYPKYAVCKTCESINFEEEARAMEKLITQDIEGIVKVYHILHTPQRYIFIEDCFKCLTMKEEIERYHKKIFLDLLSEEMGKISNQPRRAEITNEINEKIFGGKAIEKAGVNFDTLNYSEANLIKALPKLNSETRNFIKKTLSLIAHPYLKNLEVFKAKVRSLVNGVNFLHRNKFVHSDIKPSNVFISSDNKFRLGDFGSIAKCSTSLKSYTLQYLSETNKEKVARGYYIKAEYNVDFYALAISLFELLVLNSFSVFAREHPNKSAEWIIRNELKDRKMASQSDIIIDFISYNRDTYNFSNTIKKFEVYSIYKTSLNFIGICFECKSSVNEEKNCLVTFKCKHMLCVNCESEVKKFSFKCRLCKRFIGSQAVEKIFSIVNQNSIKNMQD